MDIIIKTISCVITHNVLHTTMDIVIKIIIGIKITNNLSNNNGYCNQNDSM